MTKKQVDRLARPLEKAREKADYYRELLCARVMSGPVRFKGSTDVWTVIATDGQRALLRRIAPDEKAPGKEAWEFAAPGEMTVELNGSRAELLSAVHRLATVIPESKLTGMDIRIDAGGTILSAKCHDAEGREHIPDVRASSAVRLLLNPTFFAAALKTGPKTAITLRYRDADAPLVLDYDGGDYRMALMPLKWKAGMERAS